MHRLMNGDGSPRLIVPHPPMTEEQLVQLQDELNRALYDKRLHDYWFGTEDGMVCFACVKKRIRLTVLSRTKRRNINDI